MRILVVGDWHSDIHEEAWANALEKLGHQVGRLKWHQRFEGGGPLRRWWKRAQNKLIAGPAVWGLNAEIVRRVLAEKPDVLLIYRGTHVLGSTVRLLKRVVPRTLVATYNNDDPFSPHAIRMLWRHYRRALRWTDVNMVYRAKNVQNLEALGARHVHMVRSGFIPEKDHAFDVTEEERKRLGADVLCAAHFENDGRLRYLEALVDAGVDLKIFGPDWDRAPDVPWLAPFQPIRAIRGDDYRKAICASKMTLCFLSRLNQDTYTRRCFEIPAVGGFLLCQASADVQQLFEPDREAAYFGSPASLLDEVRYYLDHPSERQRVASAGAAKVRAAGHDTVSRMKEVERYLVEARSH